MTRVMKAGETFPVPGRANLVLNTGNAGRIEILVDGTAVPSIGTPGSVRKDVPLDPDQLKSGAAVPAVVLPVHPALGCEGPGHRGASHLVASRVL